MIYHAIKSTGVCWDSKVFKTRSVGEAMLYCRYTCKALRLNFLVQSKAHLSGVIYLHSKKAWFI
jgi:hypothetical protein